MITIQECINLVKDVDINSPPKQILKELYKAVSAYSNDLACEFTDNYLYVEDVVYKIHQMSDLTDIINAVQRIDYARKDDVYYDCCGEFEDADLDDLKRYILSELKRIKRQGNESVDNNEENWVEEDDDFLTNEVK